MDNPNTILESLMLRCFRQDIRPFLKHLPEDCFKGAYAWKLTSVPNNQWEITMPVVDHRCVVNAHSAYGAKVKVFESYVEANLAPEICAEYTKRSLERAENEIARRS